MLTKIMLNDLQLLVSNYQKIENKDGDIISFDFEVKSDDYHDVTTLLYKGTFNVKIPDKDEEFIGTITEYSTSITNLYEAGNVGVFNLSLSKDKA